MPEVTPLSFTADGKSVTVPRSVSKRAAVLSQLVSVSPVAPQLSQESPYWSAVLQRGQVPRMKRSGKNMPASSSYAWVMVRVVIWPRSRARS